MNYSDLNKDNEDYLIDPDDWNETIAGQIALHENIDMNDDHWVIVKFIREYYETNQTVPELRKLLSRIKLEISDEKATRKFVYKLFPYGYGQQACKIAGMRKPLKLMLDI